MFHHPLGCQWTMVTGVMIKAERFFSLNGLIYPQGRVSYGWLVPGFRSKFDRNSQILRGVWGTQHCFSVRV